MDLTGLKVWALVVLAGAAAALGGYSYMLRGRIASLEADLGASRARAAALEQNVRMQAAELSAREGELAAARAGRAREDKRYEEAKQADPEVCAWSDAPLPGAVVDFLCQGP
jgi:hypothetical protein